MKNITILFFSQSSHDYTTVDPTILSDMNSMKLVLNRVNSNIIAGGLGLDLPQMIEMFKNGVKLNIKV